MSKTIDPKPVELDPRLVKRLAAQDAAEAKRIATQRARTLARLAKRWDEVAPTLEATGPKLDLKRLQADVEKITRASSDKRRAALLDSFASEHRAALRRVVAAAGLEGAELKRALGTKLGGTLEALGGRQDSAMLSLLPVFFLLSPTPACVSRRYRPPFPLTAAEGGSIGALEPSARPDGSLQTDVRAALTTWPHAEAKVGAAIEVRPTDRHVVVSADPFVQSLMVGVYGLGFAHAWTQLRLAVSDGLREVASATYEPANISLIAGASEVRLRDVDFPLICTFDRRSGDPTTYVATVKASTDGTTVGLFAGAVAQMSCGVSSISVYACS